MSSGLDKTMSLLARAQNAAATEVLFTGVASANSEVRLASLHALLARQDENAYERIVNRFHRLPADCSQVLPEFGLRLEGAVRKALAGDDAQMFANGCEIAVQSGAYDLMPELARESEGDPSPRSDLAAATVLKLAERLHDETHGHRDYRSKRNPEVVRRNVAGALEGAAQRFDKHQRRELVDAFLLTAARENQVLKSILHSPRDPNFRHFVETLSTSKRPGIVHLLAGYLDDPLAPLVTLRILSRRHDALLLTALLRKQEEHLSPAAKEHLGRMDALAALQTAPDRLAELIEPQQAAAVQLLSAVGLSDEKKLALLEVFLRRGSVTARRAAAAALAKISGPQADLLTVQTLSDSDPQVQAAVIAQLRPRNIAGALEELFARLDSLDGPIREAARKGLSEFTLARFLESYDIVPPEVREITGELVVKVDPSAVPYLRSEVACKVRSRRARAIDVATSMQVLPQMQLELVALADDPDEYARVQAAEALALLDASQARSKLRDMLLDDSPLVKQTAERLLQDLAAATIPQRAPQMQPAATSPARSSRTGGDGSSLAPLALGPPAVIPSELDSLLSSIPMLEQSG